ncbi:MAG: glycosyltransferase [Parcubacteria group bacterium]|jgi:glycosyltransferase involved in cell wall biosynthesis
MEQKISVIIPLYNHEKYIERAIKSIQNQTYPVSEVIVIDDGSRDDSGKIVKEIIKNNSSIKYFYQENAGAHNAINKGIKMAKGDYIAILNSDDVYYDERFKKMIKGIKDTNADVIFSGIDFIDAEEKMIENAWYCQAKEFYLKNKNLSLALINGNFFMTTSNVLIKKAVFDKVGYFSNLRYTHDLDFFLRLITQNLKIEFLNENLLYYRIHDANTIKENHEKVRREWASIIALFIVENSKKYNMEIKKNIKEGTELFKIINEHNLTKYVLFFIQNYLFTLNRVEYYEKYLKNEELNNYLIKINQ